MPFPGQNRLSRRALIAAGAVLAAPALVRADASDSGRPGTRLAEVVRRGTLRFAALATLPAPSPGDMRPDAVEVDPFTLGVAELLAEGLGLRPEIYASASGAVIPAVIGGSTDIALLPLMAPATVRRLMFATPITMLDAQVVGVGGRRRTWAQMAGRRIGTPPNYAEALGDMGLPLDRVELISVVGLKRLEAMLRAREIDDVMLNTIHMRHLAQRNPDLNLAQHFVAMTSPHGAAVAPGELDLLRALNAVLALARHSGSLTRLHQHHFGRAAPNLDLL